MSFIQTMIKTTLVLACLGGLHSYAWAQGASTESVKRLIDMVYTPSAKEAMVQKMQELTRLSADKIIADRSLNAEQTRQLKALPDQVGAVMVKEFNSPAVTNSLVSTYVSLYTPAEVDAQLRFYSSADGQSVLTKSAELGKRTGAIVAPILDDMYRKMVPVIRAEILKIVPKTNAR